MKHIDDLNELLVEQLKEQNGGERQQLVCLAKLRSKTSNEELQHVIDHHIGRTREQLTRMEQIFTHLGRNIHGETNYAVRGLVDEALELADRCTRDDVRDAGIITSIQHLNHHNIASYGTLKSYAEELEKEDITQLLKISLDEEKLTDKQLSKIASMDINEKAV